MRKLLHVAALVLCTTCANLPDIDRNVCGNGVLEKGEQCDGIGVGGVPCYAQGPSACHLDCSSPDHACPGGYACGADNVCRRGDGRFSTRSIDVSADVQRLASGDFDGDRREDIVAIGTATTRVRFFDASGNIAGEPIVVSTGAGGTTVGSLSDDGLSGLVLSTSGFRPDPNGPSSTQIFGGELNVLRGSGTRTLLPSIYPNLSVEAADLRLAIVKGADGETIMTLVAVSGTNVLAFASQVLFPLDAAPGKYGKPARIAQAGYPCESIVLPLDDKVHVYPACKGTPAAPVLNRPPKGVDKVAQVASRTVQLKDPAPQHAVSAAGSAFAISADGDGISDLLIAGNGIAYLAYGVADGTFNSTTPAPASGGDGVALPYGDFSMGVGPLVGLPGAPVTPLAIGDLDGDAKLDWIDAAGIHLGLYPGAPLVSPNGGTRWSDAYIGDANGNGAADVVAVSAAGVNFYNGNGKGELNLLSVPFDGTPTKLALGDFDGDFIPDTAVTASGGVGGDQGDALYVLFGKVSGFPEPPQLVGRLPGVQQLTSVRAFTVGTVDEILALTTRTDGLIDASALLADATRQFAAPFNLRTVLEGGTQLDGFPGQNLVGRFDRAHDGLVSLAIDVTGSTGSIGATDTLTSRLWYVPALGNAQLQPGGIVISTGKGADVSLTLRELRGLNATTLPTGSGTDEVIVIVPSGSADPGRLVVARLVDGAWAVDAPLAFPAFVRPKDDATRLGYAVRPATGDFDGDGLADLALQVLDAAGKPRVFLLRNQAGVLDAPIELPIPDELVAIAEVRATSTGRSLLAMATKSAVFLGGLDDRGAPSNPTTAFTLSGTTTTDLTAADINGDGVDDLVAAHGDSFEIHLGLAEVP